MSINISTTDISPVLNEGLWRRTPDINGVDKLWLTLSANGDNASVLWEIAQKVTPSPEYVFLQRGQHLPLSIMNVQLARRLVPAFWQPPDYSFGPGWRIRRHDDVWAMYFAKACIDSLGEVVTVGSPMIDHMKAGDMQREILSEHPTNIMQGYFTRLVDMAAEGLGGPHDYTAAALILSERMLHGIRTMYIPGHATGVLRDYATHAHAWANLFL